MQLFNSLKHKTAICGKAAFAALLLCLCVGCGMQAPQSPAGQAYEMTDDSGFVVRIAQKPRRVVSLNLGTDEILIDLVPPGHIAALSPLAVDAGLSSIVGKAAVVPVKLIGLNVEAIVALRPDLVLMADSVSAEVCESLREMGLAVHVSRSIRWRR